VNFEKTERKKFESELRGGIKDIPVIGNLVGTEKLELSTGIMNKKGPAEKFNCFMIFLYNTLIRIQIMTSSYL
jgi:hypothetical protein